MLKVNVFLGQPEDGSKGVWVKLPMKKEYLNEVINGFHKKFGDEYFLSAIETIGYTDVLHIDQYDSILDVNELLLVLNDKSEEDIKLYLTAYVYFGQSEKLAEEYLNNKKYEYFTDVEDETTLGEKVIEKGYLGYIPDRLANYINAWKVGNDWICNGSRIYSPLNTAFRQLSEGEFKERVKKGFIK